jgi:hypothetical protein
MAVSSPVPRTLLATVTLWTLAILAAPQAALADAVITDVTLFEHENFSKWSLTGSRNGGTRLQLVGSNLVNADGSFDSSITVTVGGYPAKVISFLSTPEKIVFDTPALPEGAPDCCHSFLVRPFFLENTSLYPLMITALCAALINCENIFLTHNWFNFALSITHFFIAQSDLLFVFDSRFLPYRCSTLLKCKVCRWPSIVAVTL